MVFYFKAVQLKRKLSVPEQLLICRASMAALATQKTLIPTAACFHIGYGNERLRAHGNCQARPRTGPKDIKKCTKVRVAA